MLSSYLLAVLIRSGSSTCFLKLILSHLQVSNQKDSIKLTIDFISIFNIDRQLDLMSKISKTNRLGLTSQTDLVGYKALLVYAWMRWTGKQNLCEFIIFYKQTMSFPLVDKQLHLLYGLWTGEMSNGYKHVVISSSQI
jgi:hypothetical protein